MRMQSLKNKIKSVDAAIFTVQENHFAKKGKFKLENFKIFEAIRRNKINGGTMIGVNKALSPMLMKVLTELKVNGHKQISSQDNVSLQY